MKHSTHIFLLGLVSSLLLSGCDVSKNETTEAGDNLVTLPPDPVVIDFPIAYIERPTPFGIDPDDEDSAPGLISINVFDPIRFNPGAKIFIKDRASVSAPTRNITDIAFMVDAEMPVNGEVPADAEAPLYDVQHLTINAAGTKLAFSMRAPEIVDADPEDQPTWNIWEYDLLSAELTRLISQDIKAEEGQDIMPAYLPDGSVVFSSTRQRISKSISLDQGRPQFAYVTERDNDMYAYTLHVTDEDRIDIDQISYGMGNDFYPTVLDDGRILFLRGDNTSTQSPDRLSLYTTNPDGSNLSPMYGFHSISATDTAGQGALIRPLEMPDGRILVSYRERNSNSLGGDIVAVDVQNYIDYSTPVASNLGATGPAETTLSFGEVLLQGQSPHGVFNSAYPLRDTTNRFIVSWEPCLVKGFNFSNEIYIQIGDGAEILDEAGVGTDTFEEAYQLINVDGELVDRSGNVLVDQTTALEISQDEITTLPCTLKTFENSAIVSADPQFGIWIYDPVLSEQAPVVLADTLGTVYSEAVVFEPRTAPTFIPPASQSSEGADLADENVGIIHIRSIYDFDGQDITDEGIANIADPAITSPNGLAVRFIRIMENAKMPHEDDYEIDGALIRGRNGNPAKAIMGYTKIHPDGSAMFKVPANVAFTMEFVDAKGRRLGGDQLSRHNNWLNLRPGEIRTCNGCHTSSSTEPHGRLDAQPESANPGALAPAAFRNTVLRDPAGTPYSILPDVGETMAQYYTRAKLADPAADGDPRDLSIDLVYTDEWTDAAVATPGSPISLVFGDPETSDSNPNQLHTLSPYRIAECLTNWTAICRAVIDYPSHIQPIWDLIRPGPDGVPATDDDQTCTNCHSSTDAEGRPQIPAPNELATNLDIRDGIYYGGGLPLQIDLSPIMSNVQNSEFLMGYDQLFLGRDIAVLDDNGNIVSPLQTVLRDANGNIMLQQKDVEIDGVVQYEVLTIGGEQQCAPLDTIDLTLTFILVLDDINVSCKENDFLVDADGNAADEDGNLLPDGVYVFIPLIDQDPNDNQTQQRYMNGNGANAAINDKFFNAFEGSGSLSAPNHAGFLTPAELKLMSEYLDIGGQYYNEIFKALED